VTAFVTFVGVDDDRRPVPVPPLVIESDEDKARAKEAAERRANRLARRNKMQKQ
jgi:acyl-CoA hydrolase